MHLGEGMVRGWGLGVGGMRGDRGCVWPWATGRVRNDSGLYSSFSELVIADFRFAFLFE